MFQLYLNTNNWILDNLAIFRVYYIQMSGSTNLHSMKKKNRLKSPYFTMHLKSKTEKKGQGLLARLSSGEAGKYF